MSKPMGPETLNAVKNVLAKDPEAEARRRDFIAKAQTEEFREAMAARDKLIEEVEAEVPGVAEARADHAGKHDTMVDARPPGDAVEESSPVDGTSPADGSASADAAPPQVSKETQPKVLTSELAKPPAPSAPSGPAEGKNAGEGAEQTALPAVVKAKQGVATGILGLSVLVVAGLLVVLGLVLFGDSPKPAVPSAHPNTAQPVTTTPVSTYTPTGTATPSTATSSVTASSVAPTTSSPTPVRTTTSKPVTTSNSAWELRP